MNMGKGKEFSGISFDKEEALERIINSSPKEEALKTEYSLSCLRSKYEKITEEYCKLVFVPELSDFEMERMERILDVSRSDKTLALLLNEIDELSFSVLGVEIDQEQRDIVYDKILLGQENSIEENVNADLDIEEEDDGQYLRKDLIDKLDVDYLLDDNFQFGRTDVLDIAVSEILGRGNPYAYSTLATIERYLHQFHLAGQVEVYEILTEAYLRGKRLQLQGTVIRNPHAWLKRTAYNIVREEKRRYISHPAIQDEVLDYHSLPKCSDKNQIDQLHLEMQLDALCQAFAVLTQEDPDAAQLLAWRVLNNLSWKQIWAHLAEQGGEVPNEATLRQRAARAKKHLRQILRVTC